MGTLDLFDKIFGILKYIYWFLFVIVTSSCTFQSIETNTPIPPTKTQIPNTVTPTLKPPTQTITVTPSRTPTLTPTLTPTYTPTEVSLWNRLPGETYAQMYERNQGLIEEDFLKRTGMTVKEALQEYINTGDFMGKAPMSGLDDTHTSWNVTQQFINIGVQRVPLDGFQDAHEGDFVQIVFAAAPRMRNGKAIVPDSQTYVPVVVGIRWKGKWGCMVENVKYMTVDENGTCLKPDELRSPEELEEHFLKSVCLGKRMTIRALMHMRTLADIGGVHYSGKAVWNDATDFKKAVLVDIDGNYVQNITRSYEDQGGLTADGKEVGYSLTVGNIQANLGENDIGIFTSLVMMGEIEA